MSLLGRFIQKELTNNFLLNTILIFKIVLLLSNAASYMIKTGIYLKGCFFFKFIKNYIYLDYGVKRVAEKTRNQFD